jgi:hypothetical protein
VTTAVTKGTLRLGEVGPEISGPPGSVLTFGPDGRTLTGQASSGGGPLSVSGTLTVPGTTDYELLTADAGSAGMYSVSYTIYCGFVGSGQQILSVRKNGVEVFGGSVYPASESGPSPHALDTFPVPMADGDVLTVRIIGDGLSDGFSSDWGVTAQKMSAAA